MDPPDGSEVSTTRLPPSTPAVETGTALSMATSGVADFVCPRDLADPLCPVDGTMSSHLAVPPNSNIIDVLLGT